METNRENEIEENQENPSKDSIKDSKPTVKRNEKGQLLPGSILNPEGLKEGTRHFSTIMDETIEKIAKTNNISVAEAWQVLIRVAYSEARNKNFPFYKDIMDRYFGKVVEKTDITSKGESIMYLPSEVLNKNVDISSDTKNSSE